MKLSDIIKQNQEYNKLPGLCLIFTGRQIRALWSRRTYPLHRFYPYRRDTFRIFILHHKTSSKKRQQIAKTHGFKYGFVIKTINGKPTLNL